MRFVLIVNVYHRKAGDPLKYKYPVLWYLRVHTSPRVCKTQCTLNMVVERNNSDSVMLFYIWYWSNHGKKLQGFSVPEYFLRIYLKHFDISSLYSSNAISFQSTNHSIFFKIPFIYVQFTYFIIYNLLYNYFYRCHTTFLYFTQVDTQFR